MRNIKQIIAELPDGERKKVKARGKQLIAEEMALRQLRQARAFTQQRLGDLLHMDQASISKIENRSDMLLSTLRSYVEAMGGSLRLTVEFGDGVVDLATIGQVADSDLSIEAKPRKTNKRPELVKG